MDINIDKVNPEFIEHEGFYYLEFEGEFYKGCKRCGGEGHYSHNGEHSRCYSCDNTSAKLGDLIGSDRAAAEKWCHERAVRKAQRERKAEAARMVEVRRMEAKQEALKTTAPDVYEFLMGIDRGPNYNDFDTYEDFSRADQEWAYSGKQEKSTFIRAMAESLVFVSEAKKPFTQNMIDAVRREITKRAERATTDAARPAVPEGRVQVTGTILSTKIVEGDYGTAFKVLIEDESGFKVYGTLAKNLCDAFETEFYAEQGEDFDTRSVGYSVWFTGSINEPERFKGIKGRKVTFTAAIEASKDDKSFGFFSRPTKAGIVS